MSGKTLVPSVLPLRHPEHSEETARGNVTEIGDEPFVGERQIRIATRPRYQRFVAIENGLQLAAQDVGITPRGVLYHRRRWRRCRLCRRRGDRRCRCYD